MLKRTLAAAVLALTASAASAQTNINLSAFGVLQDLLRKDLYAPFEATCNCKIVVDAGNSADRLAKLEARKDNPEIDLAVLSDLDALVADRKGLIEPIDVSKLTNFSKIYDVAKDPLGGNKAVGYTFYATSIVYRTDKVQIKAWKDLWQASLKGRLALPNITTTQGPLLLFMADRSFGGTTPDFARGIDKVAEIKGNVVTFYTGGAQLTQLFQQDEIYAAVTGRFNWPGLKKLNMPLGWASPEEGFTGGMNVIVTIKGAKNRDLTHRFIDAWLSTEAQTRLAMDKVDSPVNMEVKLPPDVADEMTYGEATAKSLKLIAPAEALANRDKWLEGWNAKIAR